MMNVEEKVIKILEENTNIGTISTESLNDITFEQLGLNSLNFIKVIVALEDEFDIEFDDEQINYELLNNISELIKLINSLI